MAGPHLLFELVSIVLDVVTADSLELLLQDLLLLEVELRRNLPLASCASQNQHTRPQRQRRKRVRGAKWYALMDQEDRAPAATVTAQRPRTDICCAMGHLSEHQLGAVEAIRPHEAAQHTHPG